MTKLNFFISCLTILIASQLTMAANTKVTDEQQLRTEIVKIIQNLDAEALDLQENAKVVITLLVNKKNQIVVLRTDNERYDKFFKETLNYKTLKYQNSAANQIYTVPVILKV